MKQKLARLHLQKDKVDKESKRLSMEIETLEKTILDQYPRKMEHLALMYASNEITLQEIERLCELYLCDYDNPITIGGRPLSGRIFKHLDKEDLLDEEGIAFVHLPLMRLQVYDKRETIPSVVSRDNSYVCVYK